MRRLSGICFYMEEEETGDSSAEKGEKKDEEQRNPLYFGVSCDIIQALQKSTCVDAKEGACLREVRGWVRR